MKASAFLCTGAVLALATSGLAPVPHMTSAGYAAGLSQPGGAPGPKKRGTRAKSKKAAAGKVSASKKQGNRSKKSSRSRSGRNAKSGVTTGATASAPVASGRPGQSTSRTGADRRVSMTAVSGVPIATPSAQANTGPGQRASLDVNTPPRSPRSRTVRQTSPAQRGANSRKRTNRIANGYVAKAAVRPSRLNGTGKVTFNNTPQVAVFDGARPANQIQRPTPRDSGVSSVITRQPMEARTKGRVRTFFGKLQKALTFRR
ncbi:hypothetical protein SAMN02745824_1797 [Parasphingorhabdus marina DSM 22363]|uniref:Uncharacterized protein n=1 Tax=Parasphingorhabdus marina DSM 22363 TaxID=1123272 RepID=A0A1N6DBU6_9SPHN|nr:hypothetical protein [Parasphingorhabdus marina]SIN68265.1 hypothetical protein SAMN02745824_1797 [Parasphingorhabdus marina DSM 22363]